MTNFPILDLILGIIFIYFLLSIISNSVIEGILSFKKARAKILESWLTTIFDGNGQLAKEIMNHPAVTALSAKDESPSYIDAKNFVTALLEKISVDPKDPKSIATDLAAIENNIAANTLLPDELRRTFLMYIVEAKNTFAAVDKKTQSEIDIFREKIEKWYDTSMDRLSGYLKQKYAQKYTLWVALAIVLFANADSIAIAKYLYNNPDARAKIASQAIATAKNDTIKKQMEVIKARLKDTGQGAISDSINDLAKNMQEKAETIQKAAAALNNSIPLGWNTDEFESIKAGCLNTFLFILLKILGLTATVFAICLGAPFWFDLLNKIANIRGTGPKPEEAKSKMEAK